MSPIDAQKAVKFGASAIVVSTHGGRQLDSAPAPIKMLPIIKNAISSGKKTSLDLRRNKQT